MPRDYAAVTSGLAKELIMPEPNSAFEKLRRGDGESRIPEDVVKAGSYAPRPESMKERLPSVFRFV
jgi:hypothetical protein